MAPHEIDLELCKPAGWNRNLGQLAETGCYAVHDIVSLYDSRDHVAGSEHALARRRRQLDMSSLDCDRVHVIDRQAFAVENYLRALTHASTVAASTTRRASGSHRQRALGP